jgi:hypothetical protein
MVERIRVDVTHRERLFGGRSLEFCRGVDPSQAEKSRPDLKILWSGTRRRSPRWGRSGARPADVVGFGVPERHGDGSALPRLVQSGNLNLEIWS